MRKILKYAAGGLVLLLLALLPAAINNSLFGYLPILIVLISMLISGLYLMVLKKKLKFSQSSDSVSVVRGESIAFKLEFHNRSWLVYPKIKAVFYIEDLFGNVTALTEEYFTLAARENREFDFSVRLDHLGNYRAGLKELILYDPLDLWRIPLANHHSYQVEVQPRICELENLPVTENAYSESHANLAFINMDGLNYSGVRDYAYGDSIKNIHWKLSSHSFGYLTKQFESYATSGTSIIIDFTVPAYAGSLLLDVNDCLIESALAVSDYLRRQGMEYGYFYFDKGQKKYMKGQSAGEMMDFVSQLPLINPKGNEEEGALAIKEEARSIYGMTNIVLCTSNLNKAVTESLIDACGNRKNPILFYILPDRISDEERQARLAPLKNLNGYPMTYFILSAEDGIKGVR